MLSFTLNTSPKKLSFSSGYCKVPDKTYTRKISISILKYSTLYNRPTLHCSIHSVNSPTYRDGLSIEGLRALLFISNAWIL